MGVFFFRILNYKEAGRERKAPLNGPSLSPFYFIQGVALLRELSAKLHVQFRLRVDNTNMNRKEIKKIDI
jgi:hypothetical protein